MPADGLTVYWPCTDPAASPAWLSRRASGRDVNLHVMLGDLFGVPVRVYRSSPDATGSSIQAVAPEDALVSAIVT